MVLVVKNLPANPGDIREVGSIPGLGRSPEEGMATHSNILAWRIPWTEEPGRLQSTGLQRVGHNQVIKCSYILVRGSNVFKAVNLKIGVRHGMKLKYKE